MSIPVVQVERPAAPPSAPLPPPARRLIGRRAMLPSVPRGRLDLMLLVLLTVVALGPRLLLQLHALPFHHNDSNSYLTPAYDLAAGNGLPETYKRPIGYPAFLSAVFAFAGLDLGVVTAVQHALGLLTVGLTFLLGRLVFNRWVGFAAALMVALSGPQLIYEHMLLPEALMTLLLLSVALSLGCAVRSTGQAPVVMAALLLGLATLVKPVGQALLPVALLLCLLRPLTWSRRLRSVALLALTFGLTVLPWSLHNLAVHGRLSVGGSLGETLIARTVVHSREQFGFDHPELPTDLDEQERDARRLIQRAVARSYSDSQLKALLLQELQLTEAELDPLLQRLTIQAILDRPLVFAHTLLDSVREIYTRREPSTFSDDSSLWRWPDRPDDDPRLADLVSPTIRVQPQHRPLVEQVLDLYQPRRLRLVLPGLAVLGLVAACWLRRGRLALVLASLTFASLLAHIALDGPVVRYRFLTEPLLSILAAGAIWTLLHLPFTLSRAQGPTSKE